VPTRKTASENTQPHPAKESSIADASRMTLQSIGIQTFDLVRRSLA